MRVQSNLEHLRLISRCSYRELSISDHQPIEIDFDTRVKVEYSQFVVKCVNGSGTVYEEAFFSPTASIQVPSSTRR
ncbi:hypothetical protein PMAYCL1PPCAC_00174, partial [Pristionchus mayeri]